MLRFGTMRDQVLGVEAVLADGTVVESLGRLIKNSTGLEARQLLVGTERTLSVITRLTLRLHPPMGELQTAWVSASHFEHLPALLRRLRQGLGSSLCAFEFMSGDFVALASQLSGTAPPLAGAPWHVLMEVAGEAHAGAGHLAEAFRPAWPTRWKPTRSRTRRLLHRWPSARLSGGCAKRSPRCSRI